MKNKLGTISNILTLLILLGLHNSVFAQTSDDFFNDATPKAFWRYFDPAGDVTLNMTGTNAEFLIPSGTAHDLWSGTSNKAPRLLQSVSNIDFGIEAKFESTPSIQYQMQGIIVQETDSKFLRFGHYSTSSARYLFVAFINGSSAATIINQSVGAVFAQYLQVERSGNSWTYSYSTDGTSFTNVTTFSQTISVTEVGVYGGNAGSNPAYTASVDYFKNLADSGFQDNDVPGVTPPIISVWYGDTQTFGNLGNPQQWINILGNVADANGISSLSYTLNGGASIPLNIGPNGTRLVSSGDFNIEIDKDDLINGANSVELTAEDGLGALATKTVTLNYQSGNVWALPFTVDWSSISNIEDINQVANIVDGLWELTPQGIHTLQTGYDRLLDAGDITWSSNLEVSVPITVHSASGGSGVGFALGWQGHTGTASPRLNWPLEAIGWVRNPHSSPYLEILTYPGTTQGTQGISMSLSTTYILKIRSEEAGGGSSFFQVKIWEEGNPEPASYMLDATIPTRSGSILMITHRADVTWGNMQIDPISINQTPQFTSTPITTGEVGIVYNYNISAADANVGDVLSITANTIPSWLSLTDYGDGTALLSGTPISLDFGVHNVELQVEDQLGESSTQSFSINVTPPGGAQLLSDNFCVDGTLESYWRIFDPYTLTGMPAGGISTISVSGSNVEIDVPAGYDHNLWSGSSNLAPRILQQTQNIDFDVEVKFISVPSVRYQMQGLIVQQDDDTFLRFEIFHDGTNVKIFAAYIDGATALTKHNGTLASVPAYLRISRSGNNWTFDYSFDGSTWQTATTFSQAITVTEVGIHGGNTGTTPPAFTAIADYFRNMSDPFPGCKLLTLTSPNGGEIWTAGNTGNITWNSQNISNIKIELSTDNGVGWNELESSFSAISGSYSLTVPNSPSSQCLVRITDTSDNSYSDISDNTFTIEYTPPAIYLRGDADLNGVVDIFDAIVVIYHIVAIYNLSGQALINADADLDNNIDINDFIAIVLYYVFHDWNYPFMAVPASSSVVFSNNSTMVNDIVELPVMLSSSQNVKSLQLNMKYNPHLFTFQSFNPTPGKFDYAEAFEVEKGQMDLIVVSKEDILNEEIIGAIVLQKNTYTLSTVEQILTKYNLNKEGFKDGPTLFVGEEGITGVNQLDEVIADRFELFQNYPNPFNPSTVIQFSIAKPAHVSLKIYDMLGKEIKTLIHEELPTGLYEAGWDGTNDLGIKVGSGTYIYRIVADSYSKAKTMILLK